jgi:hypothetical protein
MSLITAQLPVQLTENLLAACPALTASALAGVMALRLPLSVRIVTVRERPELALVICARRLTMGSSHAPFG